MKYFLFLFLFLFVYSCGEGKPEKVKESAELNKLYQLKFKELTNNPQFIIDNIELLYLKKGINNNEASVLIKKIPKKYKRIIATFNLLFSIEEPKDINLDKKFLSILLKFQDSENILKYIAKNYYKAKDSSGIKAFYILYALNYNFTEEDYENYLKIDALSDFIKLNFILKKEDYCKDDSCSSNINDKEKLLNYLNNELYSSGNKDIKKISKLYKNTFKLIKKMKKDIRKIKKKNKKLKRRKKLKDEDEEELSSKQDKLQFYQKKIIPVFKTYLYFYGKERRLLRSIDRLLIVENFLINKTEINKKEFYFIYSIIKNKPYPVRITFYKYLKNVKLNFSKRDLRKIKLLNFTKKYHLLKYGFYKRHFPELFKKLNIKTYLGSNFLYVIVKDFEWYFLEELRKNPENVKNLSYFQYAPSLIVPQKDKLFTLYTKDKVGHYKMSGNESLIYNLLKILLKADAKLTKEQKSTLEPIKIVYIKEILKHFK